MEEKDIKFYIGHCLTYIALGKNALRLYYEQKDRNTNLLIIINKLCELKTKIAKQYTIIEPNNDIGKACIKCSLQRLMNAKTALDMVVKIDKGLEPMYNEFNIILMDLVKYIQKKKNG